MNTLRRLFGLAPFLCCCLSSASDVVAQTQQSDLEAEYTRVLEQRVDKIVAPLAFSGKTQEERVKQLVEGQYRSLRDLHDGIDRRLADLDARELSETDTETERTLIQLSKETRQMQLHRKFVAELSVECSADQVEQIKDGMTYGVVPNTYKVYLEMHPDLKPAEKKQILAFLREAREYAMDAGSSDEKHDWFRKYKGKINNYLSSAGY